MRPFSRVRILTPRSVTVREATVCTTRAAVRQAICTWGIVGRSHRLNTDMTTERIDRGVGLRSERGPILLAVMLSIGLVAIDATILATAVPSVVADLGGFTQFPWLFSIYLLAQAVSVPIYGKLADVRGRKPMMLLGVGLFLIGSVLCGFAWSMPALIAFRLIQGLGAGAIQPI